MYLQDIQNAHKIALAITTNEQGIMLPNKPGITMDPEAFSPDVGVDEGEEVELGITYTVEVDVELDGVGLNVGLTVGNVGITVGIVGARRLDEVVGDPGAWQRALLLLS